MPGESTCFFLDAKIRWICGSDYGILIPVSGGGFIFKPLKSGRYKLRLSYHNQTATHQFYDFTNKKFQVVEGLWTGEILTPFVEISLVKS